MFDLMMQLTMKIMSLTSEEPLRLQDIEGIIAVQKSHIISPSEPPPSHGFLATCFTQDELRSLYQEGATLITLNKNEQVVGFLMLTPLDVFTEQLDSGTFKGDLNLDPNFQYLYQVAVLPEYKRSGLGIKLIEAAKKYANKGMIADILTEPLKNGASLDLFYKTGFITRGVLTLPSYRNFGALRSEVLSWQGNPALEQEVN